MMSYEPIRLAMLPCLTQLSVMGMINIPGLMTGQILAGTPIRDAVIYQQCIMFMVTASCGTGALATVWVCQNFTKNTIQCLGNSALL